MADLDLTIALERYDRHVPFFMGTVALPDGLQLRPLEVGMAPPRRDGIDRHRRFLQNREFDIADALEAAGLPAMHAEAFEGERFDTEIRSRHDAGLALTGDDVGTPIIAMDTPGGRQGIFGPVITAVPNSEDSLRLWDGMVAMMSVDGFWELKRTRTRRPEFPARPE